VVGGKWESNFKVMEEGGGADRRERIKRGKVGDEVAKCPPEIRCFRFVYVPAPGF